MKKVLLFAVVLLTTSMMIFAGGGKEKSGDGTVGPGVLAAGEWMVYSDQASDGGSSTVTYKTTEETIDGEKVTVFTISGNVTTKFEYGFAGWGLNADDATVELYKKAKAVSFWVLGDGKAYSVKFKISSVTDYAYHEYVFETEPGKAVNIVVPIGYFMQPSWTGSPKKMNTALVTGVEWQTNESWRKDPNRNPFEIKFWGF